MAFSYIVWDDVINTEGDLHGEQEYDVGVSWPNDPWVYVFSGKHTLLGPAISAGLTKAIPSPNQWDDPYDPDEFYPYRACIDRLRPDRHQGAVWLDGRVSSYLGEYLPAPLYIVWNSAAGDAYENELVEFNFADASRPTITGPRRIHLFNSTYYDSDLTEAEVFPHLSEEG